jgi:predicted RNA-binding Zn-ribbon protein involved in translation (DUF1610 family)
VKEALLVRSGDVGPFPLSFASIRIDACDEQNLSIQNVSDEEAREARCLSHGGHLPWLCPAVRRTACLQGSVPRTGPGLAERPQARGSRFPSLFSRLHNRRADNLSPCEEQVGNDVGLNYFAYLSDGSHIDNPRFFRQEERALARAQRRRDTEAKGTKERGKRNKVVARIHERIGNRRQNFIGQQVNLVKNPKLAKSISDVAWSAFFTRLVAKAEEAARQVVKVPPAYTSQICSCCGDRLAMPLSVRVYECPVCGLVMDRDHNASVNILDKACGRAGRVIPEAPGWEPWGVVTSLQKHPAVRSAF